jgi:hypothetical protein
VSGLWGKSVYEFLYLLLLLTVVSRTERSLAFVYFQMPPNVSLLSNAVASKPSSKAFLSVTRPATPAPMTAIRHRSVLYAGFEGAQY